MLAGQYLHKRQAAAVKDAPLPVVLGYPALEEGGGGHELSGLAIAALRYLMFDPCGLQRMKRAVRGREPFDGLNLLAISRRNGRQARPDRCAIETDGACAALPDPASELCACQLELLSNHP